MSASEGLLPAGLHECPSFVIGCKVVLEPKVIECCKLLDKQIVFATGVQVVAVYPLNNLRGSLPYGLPGCVTAPGGQGSTGKILIHRPESKTAAAALACRQTAF